MDKCFNCGAAVRPGAKFCTSCGTRLIDNDAPAGPAREPSSSTDGTLIDTAAATTGTPQGSTAGQENEPGDDSSPFASWKHASSGWNTPADTSPADRFEAALDVEEADSGSSTGAAAGWGVPTPPRKDEEEDRFASWAAAYRPEGADEDPGVTTSAPDREDTTTTPESVPEESFTVVPEGASRDTDAPRASVDSKPQDDVSEREEETALSGPEADAGAGGPTLQADDARARASSLIDELRSLVWNIGMDERAGGKDENLAVIVLAGARGKSGNYSDIRSALDAVKEHPRDLDALESLAAKADRIEELLDNQSQLLDAIDEAIGELR